MFATTDKNGHRATMAEQLVYRQLIPLRSPAEKIVIHHVTNSYYQLQLEIERRDPALGIKFERLRLT